MPSSTPAFDTAIVQAERQYDAGNKAEALQFIRKKYATMRDLSIEDRLNYYAYVNSLIMKDVRDYDRSIEIADSMITLIEKWGGKEALPTRRIQALEIKADAMSEKGLYNEAYKTYFSAKVLASANQDPCALGMYSYHMAMVLFRQQKFSDAAGFFKQSYSEMLTCVENFTYFYRKQELLDNIGLSYSKAGNYDSALIYFERSLDYIAANNGKYPSKSASVFESASAVVLGNMADVYAARGQYDTAVSLLNRSISTNLKKSYTNSDAEVDQVKLAKIFRIQNRREDLSRVLAEIRAELDSLPNKMVEREWNNLMYLYHGAVGDSLIACRYASNYIKLNDSIQLSLKSLMSSDVEGTIKSLERQHELSLLEKEHEKKNIYLLIVLAIAVAAVAIVLMVMRNASRAARDLKKLKELNNEIGHQKVQLEGLLEELKLKDKDKSRILRSVAHDVMSPISAISALTDILITEGEEFSEDHKEMLNLMQAACGNSINLMSEILDAAETINLGDMVRERTDVSKLLHTTVELLSIKAAKKKQKIILLKGDGPVYATINKDKVRRVIENILGNAIKFSYEDTSINVSLTSSDNKVVIAIMDSGVGIMERNKEKIFDMFTESKAYGTSGEKPHGIGLSIALQVARAHGGDIWFESEEGKGTTFYFEFPVDK